MIKGVMDDTANSMSESQSRPYTPSWVNHIDAWVDRLPGSSWLYYLGVSLLVFLIQTAVLWGEGAFPNSTAHRVHGFMAGVLAFFLTLLHFLDRRARAALATLRPALMTSEQEYDELCYRLTTLPPRATFLAGLAGVVFSLLPEVISGEPYQLSSLNPFPLSANLLRLNYWLIWWIFGTFLYHTVHQLGLINRIYSKQTRVNLFRMKPLYAFANLSALTAGGLLVVLYGWLIVNPDVSLNDPIIIVLYLFFTFLAVVTFIWPQLGIHHLQITEKDRLIDEANQRFEATIQELHQRVDNGRLEDITELNVTIATLEMELSTLKEIPTWPWQPETVRWLITALVLPLGLWLLQFILQRVMGP
ncbi:MAG: hypothetical protein GTO14_11000 [Anaerolineales bacterium]|nr:hypothetical protein [Anaerolineales bacterium]